MEFSRAVDLINKSENISIIPHLSADGDALGSAFSFKLMLERLGKKAKVYLEEEIQKRYIFVLDGFEYEIIDTEEKAKEIKSDLAIAVDCADEERMGARKSIFQNAEKTILIDHHQFNPGFGDINFVDVKWAATVIGVFEIVKTAGCEMDDKMANLLYIGLVTDTGGFRHTNTNPQAHMMAAELMKYNVNSASVSRNVFDNITYGRYMLNGEIAKRAEFFFGGKVCMCFLPKEVFDECKADEEDGEGIVDYLRNIENVEVSVYIREKNDGLKISLRANDYVDVACIAANFSGGGHIRASGASWDGNYEELKRELLKQLEAVI